MMGRCMRCLQALDGVYELLGSVKPKACYQVHGPGLIPVSATTGRNQELAAGRGTAWLPNDLRTTPNCMLNDIMVYDITLLDANFYDVM